MPIIHHPTTFTPGLVSVTFRKLTPQKIIALAVQARVSAIEWGGDIHVPPGDIAQAKEVAALTHDSGLQVAAYGSYYRVGDTSVTNSFERCLESAVALEAPVIRVWAGHKGSADSDTTHWQQIVEDSQRLCTLAESAGKIVAYEFHGGTLTDNSETAARLLREVDRSNIKTLWQPLGTKTPEQQIAELKTLLPWLAHLHVFYWPQGIWSPLAGGEQSWSQILQFLKENNKTVGLLLEFVQHDSPEQFLADAATLNRWIARLY